MANENIKVLMADDEEDVLEILAKKVSQEGYSVVTAADGALAWQKIVDESPDVIVLDINMPHKDGFTILKELRETPPSSKWQPVIIVSARNELEDVKHGYSLEADHYIMKPCNPIDIIKAIRLMVGLIPHHKSSE